MRASVLAFLLILNLGAGEMPPEMKRHDEGTACENGFAGPYPCNNVSLLSTIANSAATGGDSNDIWGWTAPSGREYALWGRVTGTSFVDITNPTHPVVIGFLPTHSSGSIWRDIKVYQHYALIVSEANQHGLQVFDLNRLADVSTPPVTFTEDAHYDNFSNAHNIAIDEDSGFAYVVGANCSGGLHMIDIRNPLQPLFAGCYQEDQYIHDTQCVLYDGPDPDYQGHQICFAANDANIDGTRVHRLSIIDTSDKDHPVLIQHLNYPNPGYAHQGWLTEDKRYMLFDDELDEEQQGIPTRTLIFDVQDLDAPSVFGSFSSTTHAIDHNQYTHNGYSYQSNYRAGLRILSLEQIDQAELSEVAYFDVYPNDDFAQFDGAWSVYPYYPSGNVVISSIERGLFVVHPHLCSGLLAPETPIATTAAAQSVTLNWNSVSGATHYELYRSETGCNDPGFDLIQANLVETHFTDTGLSGQLTYNYRVRAVGDDESCASTPSPCVAATPFGSCIAAPQLEAAPTATATLSCRCGIEIQWSPATSICGNSISYDVHRDTVANFEPNAGNKIASGILSTEYLDQAVVEGQTYYYLVRAVNPLSGATDTNHFYSFAEPNGPLIEGTWSSGAEPGDPSLGQHKRHLGWEVDPNVAHSGAFSYYSGYSSQQCISLDSPALELTTNHPSELSFWTRYELADGVDGGVLEISVDDGENWAFLTPIEGWPAAQQEALSGCNLNPGQGTVSGNSDWRQLHFDLSLYAGRQIILRWSLGTGGTGTGSGWYIDDVQVSHARVNAHCNLCNSWSDLMPIWPLNSVLEMVLLIQPK